MKKTVALLILVGCILTMTSCMPLSIITSVIDTVYAALNPDYEAEDESFSFGKLNITLTAEFYEVWRDDISAEFNSTSGTYVCIDRHEFMYSDFEPDDILSMAEKFRERIVSESENDDSVKNISEVANEDGIIFLSYDYSFITTEKYLVCFYKDSVNLWVVYFCCPDTSYDTYLPYFKKWARSVTIDISGTEI